MGKSTKEKQQRRLARKAKEQARAAARPRTAGSGAMEERRTCMLNQTAGTEVAIEIEWEGKLWNPGELLVEAIANDDLRALRVVEMATAAIGAPVSTMTVLVKGGPVDKMMPCAEFAFWRGAPSCGRLLLRDAFSVDKRLALEIASRMMRALEIEDDGSPTYGYAEAAVETAMESTAGSAAAFVEVTELALGIPLGRSRAVLARMRAKERAVAEAEELDEEIVAPKRRAAAPSL